MPTPTTLPTPDAVVEAVVDALLQRHPLSSIALTGGRVGTRITTELISRWPTERPLRVWFSDERFLPIGDDERNDSAAVDALQERADNLIEIESALGPDSARTVADSATDYAERIDRLGLADAAVVSIGPDGHVASLFPGHSVLADTRSTVVAITDSPKPPASRITWTLPLLLACPTVILVAVGADKRDAIARVLDGDGNLPATKLAMAGARLYVCV